MSGTAAALLPAAAVLLGAHPASAGVLEALGCGSAEVDHLRHKPGRSVIGRVGGGGGARWVAGFAPAAGDKAAKLRRKAGAGGYALSEVEIPGAPGHVLMSGPVGLDNRLSAAVGEAGLLRADGSPAGTVLNYNPWRRLVLQVRRPGGTGRDDAGPEGGTETRDRRVVKTTVHPLHGLPGLLGELRARGVPVLVPRVGRDPRTLDYAHYGNGDLGVAWSGRPVGRVGAGAEEAAAAGRILAALHSSGVRPDGVVDPRRGLMAVARGIADVLPGTATLAAATATELLRAVEPLQGRHVPLHGDFSADQVLGGPDGQRLIDLDRTAMGPAGWDVGCFAATELLAGRGETYLIPLQDAYRDLRDAPTGVEAWTGVHLMLRALEPFRAARAGWERGVVDRLRLAARMARGPGGQPGPPEAPENGGAR